MWPYYCILLIVPQVIYMSTERDENPDKITEEEEAKFGEVVKNISKVNDVLEKLITNYEHLKKLYKSKENSDSDEDEEEEVLNDQKMVSKGMKQKTKNDENKSYNDENTNDTKDTDRHVTVGDKKANTAIPINVTNKSGESDSDGSDNYSYSSSETKESKEKEVHFHAEKDKKAKPRQRYNQINPGHERNLSPVVHIIKSERPKKSNVEDKYEVMKPKVHKPEIIFLESKKHKKSVVELEPTGAITPKVFKTPVKNISTPIIFNGNDMNDDKNPVIDNKSYFKFSPAKPRFELTSYKPNVMRQDFSKIKPKVIKTMHEKIKKRNLTIVAPPSLHVKNTEEKNKAAQDQDEELIHSDQFKTDVLRTAYDEACLKLVIKKCHNACKGTIKSVCRHFNCKSNFKNRFILYEKRGCIKQFGGEEPENKTQNREYRSQKHKDRRSNNLMANDAYLSAACFPRGARRLEIHSSPRITNTTLDAIEPHSEVKFLKKINILRDRLEYACRKISAARCKTACNSAHVKVCSDFQCNKDMKSDFKKFCRTHCDKTFDIDDNSGLSSESDFDSDF